MIPALALPGEISPGQLGPINRVFGRVLRKVTAFSVSSVGIPSVMQTTRATPASAASITASAPPRGGTNITDAFAPVLRTASSTVSKIGHPSWVVPPLPGVTPPTTVVPYAAACFAWNVPSRPVRPWTSNRVDLSIRTAISPSNKGSSRSHEGHDVHEEHSCTRPGLRVLRVLRVFVMGGDNYAAS